MKKLAILITHPVQYYVPLFQNLAKECTLKVFYTWGDNWLKNRYDPGFNKDIEWDIPLLERYDYEFVENTAKEPSSHNGKGIMNPSIIRKLEEFSPNAILIHGYIYHSHYKVMRYFKGKIPVWFRGDSSVLDKSNPFKDILKTIYLHWIFAHVDKAFYVGTNNKAYFKKYGLNDKQLIFAPHAVDNQRFSEDRYDEAVLWRKRLGVSHNAILILFAGKLEPKKSPMLLLEAFAELCAERQSVSDSIPKNYNVASANQEVHLVFVGNGILEAQLKSKVSTYNLKLANYNFAQRIHFIPFQNQTQMPVAYQACNIFCLPSHGPGETWGLAINEAMAAGNAIIASDKVGCAVDLVQNNINGFTFPTKNKKLLKEKLNYMLSHPKLIKEFGGKSRHIIKKWSFEYQIKQFISKLDETN